MKRASIVSGLTVAVALALAGNSRAIAGSIEIRHEAVACVALDRYARVSATGDPPEDVASAELQFRESAAGGWYAVRMAAESGAWSAVLPRPTRALERFEYRIVMTSVDLQEASTIPFAVRVSAAAACRGETQSSAEASIVVRVPTGAPVMPPVPAGFSPAGVVAAADPAPKSSATMKLVTVATLAGGAAAGAAVAGSGAPRVPAEPSPPPPPSPPGFAIQAIQPVRGSTLSLGGDVLAVTVRVTGALGIPLDFRWRLEMRSSTERNSICVVMAGEASTGVARPEDVRLTSPLNVTGSCGSRFDTEEVELTIAVDGQVAFRQVLIRLYHFEP